MQSRTVLLFLAVLLLSALSVRQARAYSTSTPGGIGDPPTHEWIAGEAVWLLEGDEFEWFRNFSGDPTYIWYSFDGHVLGEDSVNQAICGEPSIPIGLCAEIISGPGDNGFEPSADHPLIQGARDADHLDAYGLIEGLVCNPIAQCEWGIPQSWETSFQECFGEFFDTNWDCADTPSPELCSLISGAAIHPGENHFWDPDASPFAPDPAVDWEFTNLGSEYTALGLALGIWVRIIVPEIKAGHITSAVYHLGHVAHLLSDMSVPAHTKWHWHSPDSYEKYMGTFNSGTSRFNHSFWGAGPPGLHGTSKIQGGMFDYLNDCGPLPPYLFLGLPDEAEAGPEQNLHLNELMCLFYQLAELADNYASLVNQPYTPDGTFYYDRGNLLSPISFKECDETLWIECKPGSHPCELANGDSPDTSCVEEAGPVKGICKQSFLAVCDSICVHSGICEGACGDTGCEAYRDELEVEAIRYVAALYDIFWITYLEIMNAANESSEGQMLPQTGPGGISAESIVIPLEDCIVTQNLGNDAGGGKHLGADLAASPGDVVMSPAAGVVMQTRFHSGYGGTVVIEHHVGDLVFTSVLGHLYCAGDSAPYEKDYPCSMMLVSEGQEVVAGQPLGYVAMTGVQNGGYGPHLHWGVRKGPYLDAQETCCPWTYSGIGATCTDAWIEANWYNPMSLVDACVGTTVGAITTGGLVAPGLAAPDAAVAVPVGPVTFQWVGGGAAQKYLTIRNVDTCLKLTGYDKYPVSGNQAIVNIPVPGNYRWTVFSEHQSCSSGLCMAAPRTFYAYARPEIIGPEDEAFLALGPIGFSWTPGDASIPHALRLRDITYGPQGNVDEIDGSQNEATVTISSPGKYRWVAHYPVTHCLDTSGCECNSTVALDCNSTVHRFEVAADGDPFYDFSLEVPLPVQGTTLTAGETLEVVWSITPDTIAVSHVVVNLLFADSPCEQGQVVWTLLASAVGEGDPGQVSWTVPENLPAGDYKVWTQAVSEHGLARAACGAVFTVTGCQPDCAGKICGEDGCGGFCGQCPPPQTCQDAQCVCPGTQCTPFATACMGYSAVQQCLPSGACWAWDTVYYCASGFACQAGECLCQTTCGAKECGPDGCFGVCGVCPKDDYCLNGYCAPVCFPDCADKECGDDGCGGVCGYCTGYCLKGQCQEFCQPDCTSKACGPDGCGGSCGICPDACTTCLSGFCQLKPNQCPDVDEHGCTKALCQEGGCTYVSQGGFCDDGNVCTAYESCVGGECVPEYELDCDDANPCTLDLCDLDEGCLHFPTEGPCDDGNACTTGDTCMKGWCVGVAAVDCEDENACTEDACYPAQGCVHVAVDRGCDDDDPCTVYEHCMNGLCGGGAVSSCDDANACTDDVCVPELGCRHSPRMGLCDDEDECTAYDACFDGACVGLQVADCDDGNPCTQGLCVPCLELPCENPVMCAWSPAEGPCDDGDPCTEGDACADGVCQGQLIPCANDTICVDGLCGLAPGTDTVEDGSVDGGAPVGTDVWNGAPASGHCAINAGATGDAATSGLVGIVFFIGVLVCLRTHRSRKQPR